MDEEFEVMILKSAALTVRAANQREAIMVAELVLHGERGYSEYSVDGWEVDYGCDVERVNK